MKFKRLNSFQIALKYNQNVIIGKDYGSMGRSKPLFYLEINGQVVQHGFGSQNEAKEYLAKKYVIVKFVNFKNEVLALFPEIAFKHFSTDIQSYAHLGQHGSASKSLMRCKMATKGEYVNLEKELNRVGYNNLIIINEA